MEDQVRKYYNSHESQFGYRLILQGTRHFGYYETGDNFVSIAHAQRAMEDKLGEALNLPKGALVLDAGCGEGKVATHLAVNFGLHVEGIDLLPESIRRARQLAASLNVSNNVRFREASYMNLPYDDEEFDGVYTMETLVHATDHKVALSEFYRVLKPGGRLTLFEYSMPPQNELSGHDRNAFHRINTQSAMHSFPKFTHGSFPPMLDEAGFVEVQVANITENIAPMVKFFHHLGYIPYVVSRFLKQDHHFVNAAAGVEFYRMFDHIRYNIITANKVK